MKIQKTKTLIIGAGPTGLGAAWQLLKNNEHDFLVFERNDHVGGLASSFKDENGFTWDIGGHVNFSHYQSVDEFYSEMIGDDYSEHIRISYVRIFDRWVPYPFQNNLLDLPADVQWECIEGLLDAKATGEGANFGEWILEMFGEGIAKYFMMPYNFKVWATPPSEMNKEWIAERVSLVDVKRVLKNIILKKSDPAWGPNSTFRYPNLGGTGALWQTMVKRLGEKLQLNTPLQSIDVNSKQASFNNGLVVEYQNLITTIPLDKFIQLSKGLEFLSEDAKKLVHSNTLVVGIGIENYIEDEMSWMYFPEENCPFYRITNLHNYSTNITPKDKNYRALMAEISYSEHKQVDKENIVKETIQGLVNTGMMSEAEINKIVSTWVLDQDYSYPIPSLHRDSALAKIQPELEKHQIFSRGRFGGWKYEVGNMDHSVQQGIEVIERIIQGKKETLYTY